MADNKDIAQQQVANATSLALKFNSFKSLDAVYRRFTTEKICREWLAKVRWGDVVICPHCGSIIVYKSKGIYHCDECNSNFTVLYGTIFQSTKLPLRKWFAAIWLTINNKKGVSSAMLSRELGITQKTAWYLLNKIRSLVPQEEKKVEGAVQVDCGYIGGLLRWVNGYRRNEISSKFHSHNPRNYLRNKVALLGIANKDRYIVKTIEEGNWDNIQPILSQYLDTSNIVYTDQGREFIRIRSRLGIQHATVCHESHQWKDHVTGASTSKVEQVWAGLRREVRGIFHKMPKKRAQLYVDVFVYRYNTLGLSRTERAADFFSKIYKPVTYKDIDNLTYSK